MASVSVVLMLLVCLQLHQHGGHAGKLTSIPACPIKSGSHLDLAHDINSVCRACTARMVRTTAYIIFSLFYLSTYAYGMQRLHSGSKHLYIPYGRKFSQGSNFRVFRGWDIDDTNDRTLYTYDKVSNTWAAGKHRAVCIRVIIS